MELRPCLGACGSSVTFSRRSAHLVSERVPRSPRGVPSPARWSGEPVPQPRGDGFRCVQFSSVHVHSVSMSVKVLPKPGVEGRVAHSSCRRIRRPHALRGAETEGPVDALRDFPADLSHSGSGDHRDRDDDRENAEFAEVAVDVDLTCAISSIKGLVVKHVKAPRSLAHTEALGVLSGFVTGSKV